MGATADDPAHGIETADVDPEHAVEHAVEFPLDRPIDLGRTLGPLVHGPGDRTGHLAPGVVWLAVRVAGGPMTVRIAANGERLTARAWGPGAGRLPAWLPRLLGLAPDTGSTSDLRGASHPVVADLARRLPGIRIPATGAVLDALVPAILEQKVTGAEASRAWRGLVRVHGEPAPGPRPAYRPASGPASRGDPESDTGAVPTLRLSPAPETLARLPYYAYHPFGVEQRRADLIRRVAARAAWFEAIVDLPLPGAMARLQAVPGIGPWTAAEVAVRALGDVDAVSVGDFHLPNLVAWALAREPRADDARMLALLAPYLGRRALVVRLLESSGMRAPRYGPRMSPRRIDGI